MSLFKKKIKNVIYLKRNRADLDSQIIVSENIFCQRFCNTHVRNTSPDIYVEMFTFQSSKFEKTLMICYTLLVKLHTQNYYWQKKQQDRNKTNWEIRSNELLYIFWNTYIYHRRIYSKDKAKVWNGEASSKRSTKNIGR